MSQALLSFETFSFRYKSQKAPTLKEISLRVEAGEKILIVGPSGSGKTTLGSCINGLIPFSFEGSISGSFRLEGKESKDADLHERGELVGTVLQDTDSQFVGLSVAEDIAFALENAAVGRPEMIDQVKKASAMVGMEEFLARSPFELSGGQKQRVSLAGILVDDVDLLLFDEPLANLDPKTGKVAIELIDEIHRKTGKTVIIIEHRLEDVLHRPVDRILLMEQGRIIADEKPDKLLAGSLLAEKGIREPLYIAAMKFAGCTLSEEDRAASIDTIRLEKHREKILKWFRERQLPRPEAKGPSLLRLESVSYSYTGERKALEEISFDIREGEMVSILGKNGAGKSTLAAIITGLIKQDSGKLFFRDEEISKTTIADRSREIGFVMQNPNHMISHHMIREEVGFGPKLRQMPEDEIERRIDEALKLCGLYRFRNWPIGSLSYGQKKRVTIASILVMEPKLLILDEPTAGQDYRHYTDIMEFLRRLNDEAGLTIVFITHDMHLALEYTARSIVLTDGKMIGDDSMSRIFSNPGIIETANLKPTSLYELANKLGIGEVDRFIDRFIEEEQRQRTWTSQKSASASTT
ncbi:ABC transporter ATP-binding protein [Sediminispirochaeta smaragdinae]|uniref:ABC transporter related protein n=1 Tax=Sediminispirochaeta smaragdinae (strain DSM 11293 / JCM 15392 / SEBR 4228) TaxID=573413 RepID=E1R7H3_SEDSS|nr:ABC transporter ATP-binding protein [Sediminispirochaeta smaragdinae]ADK82678.1 ABC transporter related protein [Sediminispirochaeta smaragdinae DSM 11293]